MYSGWVIFVSIFIVLFILRTNKRNKFKIWKQAGTMLLHGTVILSPY